MEQVVLIDNNDSFTYNIVDYVRRLSKNEPIVIKHDVVRVNAIDKYDKIIISPGPGLPEDFPNLYRILDAYIGKKPILGICLGHQTIGAYYGATLKNIFPVVHGQTRQINIIVNSKLFDNLPLQFRVGLYHSWIIDKENFPEDLTITSVSEDDYIMSIEKENLLLFGIQFHPESYITEYGLEIIDNFLNL